MSKLFIIDLMPFLYKGHFVFLRDPRILEIAERMVREHGSTWLMNHCKAHFQTTDKVLAACGKSRADLPPEGQVTSKLMRTEAAG